MKKIAGKPILRVKNIPIKPIAKENLWSKDYLSIRFVIQFLKN